MINFFNDGVQVFSTLILFLIGGGLSLFLGRKLKISDKFSLFFYLWHSFFCVVYFLFIMKYGGDAVTYLIPGSVFDGREFKFGTIAVVHTVRFFQIFNISDFGVSLIFNLFGVFGCLFIYASLKTLVIDKDKYLKRLILAFVFLPSFSFWSAGVGKDSIAIFSTGLALYSAINIKRRSSLLIMSIFVMLFVRPHIAGIMLISVVFSMVFNKSISILSRLCIVVFGLTVSAFLIPFALNYSGLNSDASNLESYIENRQSYNQEGGGGVDISSMSLPEQMFTYIGRPLPFEARSITQFLASLDNMFILYVFSMSIYFKLVPDSGMRPAIGNISFMWVYALTCWIILSMTTANLGIAVRQKWMFAPILMFLLISILAQRKKYRV